MPQLHPKRTCGSQTTLKAAWHQVKTHWIWTWLRTTSRVSNSATLLKAALVAQTDSTRVQKVHTIRLIAHLPKKDSHSKKDFWLKKLKMSCLNRVYRWSRVGRIVTYRLVTLLMAKARKWLYRKLVEICWMWVDELKARKSSAYLWLSTNRQLVTNLGRIEAHRKRITAWVQLRRIKASPLNSVFSSKVTPVTTQTKTTSANWTRQPRLSWKTTSTPRIWTL